MFLECLNFVSPNFRIYKRFYKDYEGVIFKNKIHTKWNNN